MSASPVRRRSHPSSTANSWWQQNQDRRAAERQHERAGRLQQDSPTTPRYTGPADRNSGLTWLTDRGRRLYERIEAAAATVEPE